jgi:hypothetical protein
MAVRRAETMTTSSMDLVKAAVGEGVMGADICLVKF